MRGIEIPEGVEVPEIEADDLEEVGVGFAVAVRAERPGPVTAPGDVSSLVHFAIERGVDVAVLERLVALQERVMERDARSSYFAALATFQEACPPIRKTRTAEIVNNDKGTKFSYTYAPLDEVAKVIRPLLAKHGLSYSWNSVAEAQQVKVTCTLRHIDGHAESSSFSCPVDTTARMSAAQKHGSALSYGQRLSLIQVTGLTTTDEDIDGAEPAGAPEPINAKQVEYLRGLLNLTGSDAKKFLRLMGVEDIAALPAARYDGAKAALEEKLAKMEERARQGQPA